MDIINHNGPFRSLLISKPIPKQLPDWNSDNIDSDEIPFCHPKTHEIWWTILLLKQNPNNFNETIEWCGSNIQYQCALRLDQDYGDELGHVIIGYFRHLDDAMIFKLRWM